LRGAIAVLADDRDRFAALALAVAAAALRGDPVHVLTRSDNRAFEVAALLREYCDALGVSISAVRSGMDFRSKSDAYSAAVVCSSQREVGLDYLRDRLQRGGRQGTLANVVMRLSGEAPLENRLLLRGLHRAFVEDADMVLIDDARQPLVIAAETDQSRERLFYEQALELARALEENRDFTWLEDNLVLTDDGRQRLAQLVSPLGGIWAAQNRCETMIVIALRALHEFVRDRDYQVIQGRVVFPAPTGKLDDERTEGDETLQRLTEVKEGLALSGRREVLARISVPRFLNRYLQLAGVCQSAKSIEHDLWVLYGLHIGGKDVSQSSLSCKYRVFVSVQAKLDALVTCAIEATTERIALLIAIRSQQEAKIIVDYLSAAGISTGVVRGIGDDSDKVALESLSRPGAVVITCYPAERSVKRDSADVPLRLVVAELHDNRRHIENLTGIYAATYFEQFLSLEDEAIKVFVPDLLKGWVFSRSEAGELPARESRWLSYYVQSTMEREQRHLREELLSREMFLKDLLAFGGQND
jgi:preprotein translocase subunit SecA